MNTSVRISLLAGASLAIALGASLLGAPPVFASPACNASPVASGTGAATVYTETFTTAGTCEWTAPAGVVRVDVLLVSGGGGGGGGQDFAFGSPMGGGGGGAGGQARVFPNVNVQGAAKALTVGDGGAGGLTGQNGEGLSGASGDASSFGTSIASTGGGGTGGGVTPGVGGNGGDVNGTHGGQGTNAGGGGGGGAGQGGAGSSATNANGANGDAGGIATSTANTLFAGWSDVYGGGGGGASATATPGTAGAGGGTGGTGMSSPGNDGTANSGGGGGGGGIASAGGKGGSGLVVLKYQVASVSPSTLTINATVGQAITTTTFAINGVGATPINQWCMSTPGTYDNANDTYELVPGIMLNGATCELSGTPTAAQASASFAISGGGHGTVPASGESTVTITVSAAGGGGSSGGSGGGGGSSSSEPTPSSSPAPSSTTTPTDSAPPALDPVVPGSNPNIPASGVPLGASVYLVNGEPQSLVVKPDAPKDATGIDVLGDGFTMKLAGLGANGVPLGVTSDGALILQQDRTAAVEGTGFQPNSDVNLYAFSTPRFLGSVKTDANGNFKGTVPLPMDIPAGRHTLQSNGFAPDGAVRSLSLGVLLSTDKAPTKARVAKTTVYFDALSAQLSSTAKASLKTLAKGRALSATRTVVVGYVQPSGTSHNDQTLSTLRAKTIAAYLRSLGLRGTVMSRGDGVSQESGAAGRKAVVALRYVKR